MKYSYCESVYATGISPWHIRILTEAGQKKGGGADTLSLCGREMGWDVVEPMSEQVMAERGQYSVNTCRKCGDAYRAMMGITGIK